MKCADFMVGDWVRLIGDDDGLLKVQVEIVSDESIFAYIDDDDAMDELGDDDIEGIPIAPEILEKNGWERHEYMYVLKSNPRLGWYTKTHELIIGYHTFPIVVNFVHELQHLMKMLCLEEIKI